MKSHFLIGAISSGSGKTTVTLGLLRALSNRGLDVQSFKCGPDYIDIKFHELASGRKAINLDLFLSSPLHVENIYKKYSCGCDVAIVEGVMGLFDGYLKMQGSSAEIASMLGMPVILVLNAKSMAYTVAPLLYGLKNFIGGLNIVGVIFNMVNSESHYSFLADACVDVGIVPLGYLPKNEEVSIASRHLGLSIDKGLLFDEFADKVATYIEQYVDVDRLLDLTGMDCDQVRKGDLSVIVEDKHLRIAVAYDEAFNFFYHENIESLKRIGSVIFFSPICDAVLPDADLVYLPGGYPELFAKELSANASMLGCISDYIERGGKLLAECGGMMYLSESIIDKVGTVYPMVGIFDQRATMERMRLRLGYRSFCYNNVLFRGHEFHYSSIDTSVDSVVQQYNARGMEVDTKLLRYKNVVAGYTHIYWAENDNVMDLFK